jgi:dihydroorotase-like cyclic amidohydrolase
VLVDPPVKRTLRNANVLSKAGWTPFDGGEVTGQVVRTFFAASSSRSAESR